jgi:phage gp29-like protein
MPKNKLGSELGITGLLHWHGEVQDHFIADLKTSSKKIKTYDEMYRLDSTAATMINVSSMFMRNAGIDVEPASLSEEDLEAAEFLRECLHDMTSDFERVMADIVMFLPYGWMDMEIVYMKRDGKKSKFDDGRIGWRKWAPRHPVTLDKWEFDANGGLQGMHQLGPPDYKSTYIPIEKLLHFTTTGLGKGNPEGQSVLEGGYRPWWTIKGLSVIECILAERASGTPVIELPEGATTDSSPDSDLERAKTIVRNVKVAEDMGLTLPHGFKFYYETPKSGPAVDIGSMIMRRRRSLSRVLTMDFIMLGGGDQGSWSMHSDKSALYIRALGTYLKVVAHIINRHAIPRLFALNAFPGITGLPKVYFQKITKIDIGGYAEVIARLFNSGAVSYDLDTENAVRREVGLPEVEEPGIVYKPPMLLERAGEYPAQKPEEEKPEGEDEDEEGDEEEGLSEFAENVSGLSHAEAVKYVDQVGNRMVRDYDGIAGELADALAGSDDEEQWEAEIDAALFALAGAMQARLRRGMFGIWRKTTGGDPDLDGLEAILEELKFQQGYIDDSLVPAIKRKVLAERRDQKEAATSIIILAIVGVLAAFKARIKQYAGGIYKIQTNHASSSVIFRRMLPVAKKAGETIARSATGHIYGPNVLCRYVGHLDSRTCDDCRRIILGGWQLSVPPVGSNKCGPNDRCYIEYKFRGRIYC